MSSPYSPAQTATLKKVFKLLNRWIVFVFRTGYGPIFTWPAFWGKIMVIEHTGRKTGRKRYAPVNYALSPDQREVYCLSGFGQAAQWYRNIIQRPEVAVWIGARRIQGKAHPIAPAEPHLAFYRQILINSGFATPLFEGFNPKTAPEETIRSLARRASLVHITLEEPLISQQPHPGDLAWTVISLLFLWVWLRPRHKESS